MNAYNSSIRPYPFIFTSIFLILISSVIISWGSAEDCIDPNQYYPNEEQFCDQYVYWNASSIETPVATISFKDNFQIRVAFDLYCFMNEKSPQKYAQIEIMPIGSEYYATTMNLVVDESDSNSPSNTHDIACLFMFDGVVKKNGVSIQNYSYIFGADNYLLDTAGAEMGYKRIIISLDNNTLNETDRYCFDYSINSVIQIQRSITPEESIKENYTLVSDSEIKDNLIVRRVSRVSNENLEIFFTILNSDYFDIGLFLLGILCTILFAKKSPNHPKSVIQFNIAFKVDFLPNLQLQESIKPYLLYMFTPIPLIFIARLIPVLGYIILLFYLNFIPIFIIIYHYKKHQTMLPFKSFIKWQIVTFFIMYFVILSIAFTFFGYFLDLMQLILYLLTFVYIFDLVRDRKIEYDANTGSKKVVAGFFMIVILFILILKYIIPLIILLVVQTFIAGDYPLYYQYYLFFLKAGLDKIRWNMGIGGILLLVYIINQFQYNLLQTYDPQAEKKFILKLTFSIYIFVYIMATVVIGDLADNNILSGILPSYAVEFQKNPIPYGLLSDLYPESVIFGLRSFISTTPSPFWNNNPLAGIVWVNFIIAFGILCFLPRLCYIIGTPARMRYYDYEQYFHHQYKHYYAMSGLIAAVIIYFTLFAALEICLLIFLGAIILISIRLLKGLI